MIERHWCVHAVYVLEAMNIYVYLLGVRIHWGGGGGGGARGGG